MNSNSTLSKLFFAAIFSLAVSSQLFAQTATINWAGTSGLSTAGGSSLTGSKTNVTVGTKVINISYSITTSGSFDATTTFSPSSTTSRILTADFANKTSSVTLTLTFSSPVAITNFPIINVGYNFLGNYNDSVKITGSNGGNTTNYILQFYNGATTNFNPSTLYSNLNPSITSSATNLAGAPALSVVGDNSTWTGTNDINFITNATLPGVTKLVITYKSGSTLFTNPSSQSITFQPFTISSAGASAAPLPVTFANVSAKETNGKVGINWSNLTESEINYYEIERSSDGANFSSIGKVSPKANDFSSQSYSFTDATPNAVNFYRVKAVEFAGTYKTTTILKVSNQVTGKSFQVYPNPVENKVVTIQTNNIQGGVYSAQVVTISGQVLMNKNVTFQNGSASQSFELPANINPGTYLLRIQNGDTNSVTTLFVK